MLAISVEQILFCWLQLLFQLLTRSGGHPKGWKRLIPKFQCDLSNNFYEPLHELPKVWYTRALPPSGDWPHWCLPIQTEACSRQKTSSGSKRMACACGERRQRPRPYNGVVGHRTHNGREGGGGRGKGEGRGGPTPTLHPGAAASTLLRTTPSESEVRGQRSAFLRAFRDGGEGSAWRGPLPAARLPRVVGHPLQASRSGQGPWARQRSQRCTCALSLGRLPPPPTHGRF